MSKGLRTDSYVGVRDFYPEDMAIQSHIFETWAKTAESFGFERYDASVLEPAELYRSKTSEEIVNEQTYTFTDRGDREVTLRPEMTPTVARMVAGKRRELQFPLRWYSIPNLFRYERTQRGRLREHWQLNCDIFGSTESAVDAEIILLAAATLKAFGAKSSDFEIRINHRGLLEEQIVPKLASSEALPQYLRLLDRKSKMSGAEFKAEEQKLLKQGATIELAPDARIESLLETLRALGVENARFEPTIVRGFDYYTGVVFEIFDTHPENNRSLLGGGRYDDLTGLFGGEPISGIGFGMGDVTMRNFLEAHGLLPTKKTSTDIALVLTDIALATEAESIAQTLRAHGLKVAVDLSGKKLGDQIKRADKHGIPYIIVVGEDELKKQLFSAKKLADGSEVAGTLVDIAKTLI